MAHHVIQRGLDIPIAGKASGQPVALPPSTTVAVDPREIRGFIPRVAAREGDEVQRGTPLLYHKVDPRVKLVSPVAGRVREIRRGARRVITEVVIERTGDAALDLGKGSPASMTREQILEILLASGLWPTLRTRPLDRMARAEVVPQSILVGGMETGPLQPGADVMLGAGDAAALQAGIDALKKLTDGKVFLTSRHGATHPALDAVQGVERHTFSGPHPAGCMGVQVNLIDPPRGTRQVWTISAWDAALIGRLFLEGAYPAERVYAAVGAGVKTPRFVRALVGCPVTDIVGAVNDGPARWIRGSVLTGDTVEPTGWASHYRHAVHVLPSEVKRELLGWALPRLGRFSVHRAFLSGFSAPSGEHDMRPGLNGGHRAIIPLGYYEKVVATPDIMPTFLFKSILAGDIEESVQLGMLDLTEEEAALCAYVCPSKIEFDEILRGGLEQYAKEVA